MPNVIVCLRAGLNNVSFLLLAYIVHEAPKSHEETTIGTEGLLYKLTHEYEHSVNCMHYTSFTKYVCWRMACTV